MKFDDYLKLKNESSKYLDKLYVKRDNIQDFIYRTDGGTRTAQVELAHIEELISHLEEIQFLIFWFIGEE